MINGLCKGSLGEKYMQEKFLCEESLGEKYVGVKSM